MFATMNLITPTINKNYQMKNRYSRIVSDIKKFASKRKPLPAAYRGRKRERLTQFFVGELDRPPDT